MKKVITSMPWLIAALWLFAAEAFSQATVKGYVRTISGNPIQGATVRLLTLNQSRTTDARGYFDFGVTEIKPYAPEKLNHSLVFKGKDLLLSLNQPEQVSVQLFNLSGKMMNTVVDKSLSAGRHAIPMTVSQSAGQQLYLAKLQVGAATSFYKLTALNGNLIGIFETHSPIPQRTATAILPADSIVVTHSNYWGGLNGLHARRIPDIINEQHFRLFSNDTSTATGWYASEMLFYFEPHHVGVDYFKRMIPQYVWTERQVQRMIQQVNYTTPASVPSNKKWATYRCNINANVTTGVASTGGNTLNFNPVYINNKPLWELLGVLIHEMNHSYQQFYNTPGASGFGEGITDGVRALCGFFYWPKGTRCSGGYAQAYQGGGRYWYFIELKHPGFINKLMNMPNTGDISARVQTITGQTLASLCTECETVGMPYTNSRGRF